MNLQSLTLICGANLFFFSFNWALIFCTSGVEPQSPKSEGRTNYAIKREHVLDPGNCGDLIQGFPFGSIHLTAKSRATRKSEGVY